MNVLNCRVPRSTEEHHRAAASEDAAGVHRAIGAGQVSPHGRSRGIACCCSTEGWVVKVLFWCSSTSGWQRCFLCPALFACLRTVQAASLLSYHPEGNEPSCGRRVLPAVLRAALCRDRVLRHHV